MRDTCTIEVFLAAAVNRCVQVARNCELQAQYRTKLRAKLAVWSTLATTSASSLSAARWRPPAPAVCLQHVGDHQRQLKARRVVVTYDVVAEIEHFGRRHQNQEEDDDRNECCCQATAFLISGLAGHHARG